MAFWQPNEYLVDEGPNPLIDLQDIIGHVVRSCVSIAEISVWATIRVSTVCPGNNYLAHYLLITVDRLDHLARN